MRVPRLRLRPLTVLTALCLLILGGTFIKLIKKKNIPHVLNPTLYREHNIGPWQRLLLPDRTQDFCKAHGFQPVGPIRSQRKVYDLFLINTELDWLEIRLHTLTAYVDFFVIVESKTTFTGLPKPLYLEEHWSDFAAFHHKIIYRVVEDPGSAIGSRAWDHEDYMRNALFTHVFPTLVGTDQEAHADDVLLVSDIDEIPKPEALVVLKLCDFPLRLTLRSHFYYYSFQWRHVGEQWAHPQATIYQGLDQTILPQALRSSGGSHGWFWLNDLRRWLDKSDFWDAAWHCSSCFATVKEMQIKMESFSHVGWNLAEHREPKTIVDRVRNGLDLFNRTGEMYEKIVQNKDVPAYIYQHSERFGYMLDRDGADAGFTDYHVS